MASAEATASEVGIAILARGGNAVDAAVAVGFALGVTHPSAANIGGGGFMLVRFADGRTTAIDYREVAPGAAQRDMFLDAAGELTNAASRGPLSAGIPGVVAGFALAHAKYGSLPWAVLLEPAIALARDGVVLDSFHANELGAALKDIEAYASELAQPAAAKARAAPAPGAADDGRRTTGMVVSRLNPMSEVRSLEPAHAAALRLVAALRATQRAFGKPDGSAYRAGERWRQPALARTLQRLAEQGPETFYRGAFAAQLADQVRALGGLWTAQDLAKYQALERTPIVFDYHAHQIATMPPPSAGGMVLRQVLAAADSLNLRALDWNSTRRIHLYVEILRRAYADRNELMGDPAFVNIPLETLLSTAYIEPRMRGIDPDHATPSSRIRAGIPYAEPPHTTHFSIVDPSGMAVANTYTLNTGFGALAQIADTGITLNNEMDDFSARPGSPNVFGLVQGLPNAIQPGKRMLSSMSPTIVSRNGKLRAVLGSPGGPTISTTVAQILLQLIDHRRSLPEAVAAPRIHHQWMPDEILLESGVPAATRRELAALGHKLVVEEPIGHAHCIEVDPTSGILRAVADLKRGGGGASAY